MADDADPFARHATDVRNFLASADADEIKRSYQLLGGYLEQAYTGSGDVPVLSWPETTPVVIAVVPTTARRVLDAGCGPNPVAAIGLRAPGRGLVGLDIGIGTVRLAVATARAYDTTLLGVVGDIEHLPFRGDAFDAVVCDDTVEHVPDDRAATHELARVLAPHGTAVVATPNRRGLTVLARKARDRVRRRRLPASAYYATESHLREYTPAELRRVVADSFVITRSHPVGWRGHRVASSMIRLRPFVGLSKVIVITARPIRSSGAG
ncbi:MAG: class I SAM-dependent methyltransferase [Acidimicrobiales bacterium]